MQRSFYYWRTAFRLSPSEQQALRDHAVKTLYVKFFDVDWNSPAHTAEPVAKCIFQQPPPAGLAVTPVVFITQAPLQKLDSSALTALAKNTAALLSSMATNNRLALSSEVQVDSDWTAATKAAYFFLLERLKEQPFFRHKTVSATVRLHQLKFVSQAGVPPVDKGLLMCYNMGNLRHPQTKNSILDEDELKKYLNTLGTYPLPLDVAFPVFDWYVLFDGSEYKGLVRDFDPGAEAAQKSRLHFAADTVVDGYRFRRGQWLRHERSDVETVKKCAGLVGGKLKANKVTVILYHLDEENLNRYNRHELEDIFDRLR